MAGHDDIRELLAEKRAELEELRSSIPAHSTSISHIAQMEDLEEEIEELERRLGGSGLTTAVPGRGIK